MKIFLVVLVLAAVVLALLFRSSRESGEKAAAKPKKNKVATTSEPAPKKSYGATSIVHDDNACEAVKAIGNKRFLDSEHNIPVLPMPACDVEKCNCKYVRHEDRRSEDGDRRHHSALKSHVYETAGESERREKKHGRRKTD